MKPKYRDLVMGIARHRAEVQVKVTRSGTERRYVPTDSSLRRLEQLLSGTVNTTIQVFNNLVLIGVYAPDGTTIRIVEN